MYNDNIKVANKIISDSDLLDIFQKMDDEIRKNIKICKQETVNNEGLESKCQHWTTKNFDGVFKCNFNFYDDTNVMVDNYNTFITIFNGRLHEVKDMWINYRYSYGVGDGLNIDYISQSIMMNIYESKMDISVNLSSKDKKMDDVYELIKEKILRAPERYDRVIKDKGAICNKIGFATGMIPSLVICTLLAFITGIREMYCMTYILYPILAIVLAFFIGNTFLGGKLDSLYSSIVPEKKYAGYDTTNNKSIYKDDMDKFLNTSEIIIGKNIDNIKNRKKIIELEDKYSKYIPGEIVALVILSLLMIVVGKFI